MSDDIGLPVLTMLPPCADPEYRKLIEKAEYQYLNDLMTGPMIAKANIYNIRQAACYIEMNDYRKPGKRKMLRQK